jgi:hypothetical protein
MNAVAAMLRLFLARLFITEGKIMRWFRKHRTTELEFLTRIVRITNGDRDLALMPPPQRRAIEAAQLSELATKQSNEKPIFESRRSYRGYRRHRRRRDLMC